MVGTLPDSKEADTEFVQLSDELNQLSEMYVRSLGDDS